MYKMLSLHCLLISIEVVINFAFDFYNRFNIFTIELFSNATIPLDKLNRIFNAFKTGVFKYFVNIKIFLKNKCNVNNCKNIRFLCQFSWCLTCPCWTVYIKNRRVIPLACLHHVSVYVMNTDPKIYSFMQQKYHVKYFISSNQFK